MQTQQLQQLQQPQQQQQRLPQQQQPQQSQTSANNNTDNFFFHQHSSISHHTYYHCWRINIVTAGDHLTFIHDRLSSQQFLIDTGASKSVIPHQSALPPTCPSLYTANDQPITTWGFKCLPVQFGNRRFHFPFILAAASTTIISHDFLQAHHIFVDPAHHCLLYGRTLYRRLPFPHSSSCSATPKQISYCPWY
jgi:hypothetical protein